MEFRLTYRGPLPVKGNDEVKQKLRKNFHAQLSELWRQEPLVNWNDIFLASPENNDASLVFKVGRFLFVPLVSERIGFICQLEILFLRRQEPGMLIGSQGDIDNRLKNLFDALRIPTKAELNRSNKEDWPKAEEIFFCLLEDDALITKVGVTTDRLLEPYDQLGEKDDVYVVVHVTTKAARLKFLDHIFMSG
jgi:hypothetical protein